MNENHICGITSTECLYEQCDKCQIENHEIQLVPIDKALEIIDKYATYIFGNGLSEENQIALWDDMRDNVLALKEGEQK